MDLDVLWQTNRSMYLEYNYNYFGNVMLLKYIEPEHF